MRCLRISARHLRFINCEMAVLCFICGLSLCFCDSANANESFSSLAISADGEQVAIGFSKGQLSVQETKTRKRLHSLMGHEHKVTAVAFSADGSMLVSVDILNYVIKWDLKTGKPMEKYDRGSVSWRITGIAFVGKSGNFVVGTNGGTVEIVDFKKKKSSMLLEYRKDGRGDFIHSVACSESGRIVAASTNRNEIYVWRLGPTKRLSKISADGVALGLAISSDEKQLAFGLSEKVQLQDHTKVQLWDLTKDLKGKAIDIADNVGTCLTFVEDEVVAAGVAVYSVKMV